MAYHSIRCKCGCACRKKVARPEACGSCHRGMHVAAPPAQPPQVVYRIQRHALLGGMANGRRHHVAEAYLVQSRDAILGFPNAGPSQPGVALIERVLAFYDSIEGHGAEVAA